MPKGEFDNGSAEVAIQAMQVQCHKCRPRSDTGSALASDVALGEMIERIGERNFDPHDGTDGVIKKI